MNIQDLCERSGVSRQTIYRYMQMGLLPKPVKTGFKRTPFDESHLKTLIKIRELRDEKELPLQKIKELLLPEVPENIVLEVSSQVKKEQIVDKGIDLFSKNGFAETKISDITDALGVAQGTFYHYFKSKRDLFLDCISRVTMIIIPEDVWLEVNREQDFFEKQRIKLKAFLKVFPRFSGILTLLKFSLQSEDPAIADKARDVYNILGKHLVKDMKKAIENKEIQGVNVEIMSLLLHGMAETLGFISSMDSRYTYEEGTEIYMEFLKKGLHLSETESSTDKGGECWNVTDLEGTLVQLRNIGFNGSRCFSGSFGGGEIRVDMGSVSNIRMEKGGLVAITSKSGEEIRLTIDESLLLSGQSVFGEYHVPLSKISSITTVLSSAKSCL